MGDNNDWGKNPAENLGEPPIEEEKKMLWLATVPFDIAEDLENCKIPVHALSIHQNGKQAGAVYYPNHAKVIYIIIDQVVYAVQAKDLWLAVQEQVTD